MTLEQAIKILEEASFLVVANKQVHLNVEQALLFLKNLEHTGQKVTEK